MIVNKDSYNRYYQGVKNIYQQPVMRASIEVILSVFAVALMVMLAIKPTLTIVVSLRKKIEDQSLVEKKITAKIAALSQAQASLTNNSSKLVWYEKAVPDKHTLDGLAKRLEILVQEGGVRLESLQFSAVPLLGDGLVSKGEEAETVVMSFSVEGKLDQLLALMQEMERLDRVLLIKEIALQKQDNGRLKLTGKAEAYYKEKGGES